MLRVHSNAEQMLHPHCKLEAILSQGDGFCTSDT